MNNLFIIDFILFIVINLANLSSAAMFFSRVMKPKYSKIFGLFFLSLGIPTFVIVILNFFYLREWWTIIYPLIFIGFTIFSLIVDYLKPIEFRKSRDLKILIPFLLLYYVGILLMWGITWTLGLFYGIITGITYFIQLIASIYAGKMGMG